MAVKKVTDHFGRSVTPINFRVTGNRWVTDRENDLLPRNPMFSLSFFLIGNRVTDNIESIKSSKKGVKIGKKGKIGGDPSSLWPTRFYLLPVTSTAFWGSAA